MKLDLYDKETKHVYLHEIIDEIKSDRFSELVNEIRISEKKKRNSLKDRLPIFYPCIELFPYSAFENNISVSATGLVQFDFDVYDIENIKEVINQVSKLDETVYAFISPSGGVKFAIKTDFQCEDKSIISDLFRIAYTKTLDYLIKQSIDLDLDENPSSIKLGCLFSFDPEAYYNENAKILKINDSVYADYKILEKENLQKEAYSIANIQYPKSEDEVVLDALKLIPGDLKYNKERQGGGRLGRLEVNGAVASHFGDRAESILLNHWKKDDQKKLLQQIRSQIRSLNQFSIGTLLREAEYYGWKKPVVTGIHAKQFETDEKGTYQTERISVIEAKRKLSGLIQDFFEEKKSTIILCEAGVGKTTKMIDEIAKFNQGKNLGKYIAIFVKTYDLADEIENELNKLLGSELVKNEKAFLPTSKVHKIQGIDRLCRKANGRKIDENDKIIQRKKISLIGPEICKKCEYGFEYGEDLAPQCQYIRQYDYKSVFLNRIRIYNHNHLFTPSQYDPEEGFKPDYIIIDEDIIESMTDVQKNTISYSRGELPNDLKFVYDDLENGKVGKIDKVVIEKYKNELLRITKKLEKMNVSNSKFFDLHKERNELRELIEFISMYNQTKTKKFLSSTGNNAPVKLLVGNMSRIDERWKNIPILYLDASGNEQVIKNCFGTDFKIEKIRVKYSENVTVTQVVNKTFSKNQLNKSVHDWKKIEIFLKNLEGNTSIITYKEFVQNLMEIGVEQNDILHFGAFRGLDKFKDYDNLVVIGRYRLPSEAMMDKAILLWNHVSSKDEFIKDDDNVNPYFRWVPQIVERTSGKNVKVYHEVYLDKRLRLLADHIERGELYQAVHRLRLIHGDKNKNVYILTNTVADIAVDRTVKSEELLGTRIESAENLDKIKRAIDDFHFVEFTNKDIAAISGLPVTTVKNLKKNHRQWFEDQFKVIDIAVKTHARNKSTRTFLVSRHYEEDICVDLVRNGLFKEASSVGNSD